MGHDFSWALSRTKPQKLLFLPPQAHKTPTWISSELPTKQVLNKYGSSNPNQLTHRRAASFKDNIQLLVPTYSLLNLGNGLDWYKLYHSEQPQKQTAVLTLKLTEQWSTEVPLPSIFSVFSTDDQTAVNERTERQWLQRGGQIETHWQGNSTCISKMFFRL